MKVQEVANWQLLEEIEERFGESDWETVKNKWMGERYIGLSERVTQGLGGGAKRVLDFGCGEGQVSWMLARRGVAVVGIELETHEAWRQVPEVDWVVYGGQNLPFGNRRFDGVTMFGVLEHVGPDPKTEGKIAWERNQEARRWSLRECRRVLKPGGKVWIYNFPNPDSPVEKLIDWVKPRLRHRGSERQRLGQVVELVESAGLEVVEAGRSGVLPAGVGNLSPRIRDGVANRWHRVLAEADRRVDRYWAGRFGQSNYVIARK